jgi:hypothetical protein
MVIRKHSSFGTLTANRVIRSHRLEPRKYLKRSGNELALCHLIAARARCADDPLTNMNQHRCCISIVVF